MPYESNRHVQRRDSAYIEALLPDVLESRIEPGGAFDPKVRLDDVPGGGARDERPRGDKETVEP